MAQKSVINESQQIQQAQLGFDFTSIDEMDPSLADGHKIVYDREIPFHIRFQDKNQETQNLPNQETLRVRIYLLGDDKTPQQVKIELSSDNDLFFHFTHIANDNNYKLIKQAQSLNIEFIEYPTICLKCFNKCEKDLNQYAAIFTILADGQGKLEIIQNTEYKNVEIISFDFQSSPEDFIRQIITFRYMSLKSKLSLMEGRLSDINEIVRLKNPSLLLQIQKSVPSSLKNSTVKK